MRLLRRRRSVLGLVSAWVGQCLGCHAKFSAVVFTESWSGITALAVVPSMRATSSPSYVSDCVEVMIPMYAPSLDQSNQATPPWEFGMAWVGAVGSERLARTTALRFEKATASPEGA